MNIRSIDIVIPVCDPDIKFEYLLEALSNQTILPNRIILLHTITENGNLNQFRNAIFYLKSKQVAVDSFKLYKEEFDHGGTRDFGMRISKADLVIMMTQDAVPEDNMLIEELLNCFKKDDKVGVAYARQLPAFDSDPIECYSRNFNYPAWDIEKARSDILQMGIKAFFCSDVCAAYKKDLYTKLGGFPNPVIFNEDMIMARKIIDSDRKVYYASRARVIHSHNLSNGELFKRNFDLGVSQRMHPEVFGNISSESEGKQLVMATVKYLFRIGKPFYTFRLLSQSISKYAGYYMGKRYKMLKPATIMKYTSNPYFWERVGFGSLYKNRGLFKTVYRFFKG